MLLSLFLAKVWGLYLVIIALAFLGREKKVLGRWSEISNQPENFYIIYLTGAINLFVGLILVLLHSVWSWDWRLIVTLFGWLVLFKGLIRLFSGERFVHSIVFFQRHLFWLRGVLFLFLMVGIYLLYISFWVY